VEAVDVEQDQRAMEAGTAFLFVADLAAQVAGVGQLRDAVEGAVVAEQAFALLQVFVEAELFVAPVYMPQVTHSMPSGTSASSQ
jgi:hypothetical protein